VAGCWDPGRWSQSPRKTTPRGSAEAPGHGFSGPSILPHQLHRPHPQRRRQLVERDDRRVALTAFEVADILLAHAGALGQGLLGQAGGVAQPRGVSSVLRQAQDDRLGMDIPGWPPENIEEMAKKLEQELLG